MTAFQSGVDGRLGFRFECPTAYACYGHAHLLTTAPWGNPTTLLDYCYNALGHEIVIPGGNSNAIFCNGFEDTNGNSCFDMQRVSMDRY